MPGGRRRDLAQELARQASARTYSVEEICTNHSHAGVKVLELKPV